MLRKVEVGHDDILSLKLNPPFSFIVPFQVVVQAIKLFEEYI